MESINLFGDGFVAAVVLAFVIIPIWVIGKVLIEDSWPKDLQQKVAYYRMNTPPEWRFDDRIEKNHFFFDLDNERFFCYRTTRRLTWWTVPFKAINSVVPIWQDQEGWTKDHSVAGAYMGSQVGGSLGAMAGAAAGRSRPYYSLDSLGYTFY